MSCTGLCHLVVEDAARQLVPTADVSNMFDGPRPAKDEFVEPALHMRKVSAKVFTELVLPTLIIKHKAQSVTVEGRIEFDVVNRLLGGRFTLTPVQDTIDEATSLVQPNDKPSCSLKGSECVEATNGYVTFLFLGGCSPGSMAYGPNSSAATKALVIYDQYRQGTIYALLRDREHYTAVRWNYR